MHVMQNKPGIRTCNSNHFLLHTRVLNALVGVFDKDANRANRAHSNGELEACWVNQPDAILIAAGDVQSHWYIRIVWQAVLHNTPDVDMQTQLFNLCENDKPTLISQFLSKSQGAMVPTYIVLRTCLICGFQSDIFFKGLLCFSFLFCVIVFCTVSMLKKINTIKAC